VGGVTITLGLDEDRSAAQRDVADAREELLTALNEVTADDFERSRHGGWSLGRVVQHIIQSEWHYAHLVRQLRERPPVPLPQLPGAPTTGDEAVRELAASRQSLLDALGLMQQFGAIPGPTQATA
jgi:uncharacterized damage-inducible protein DinB